MNTKSFIAAVAVATLLAGSVASAQQPTTSPTPNQIVYVPQLPAVADLAKGASGQGMTIAQINQTSDQITVVYKLASGQTNTVAYRPLSAANSDGTIAMPSSPAPAYTAAPSSTVVYTTPAPVYYAPEYYGPGYYWPYVAPVSIGLGWGWGGHWGYRGGFGFRGGWR